jgi:hypothetical protein
MAVVVLRSRLAITSLDDPLGRIRLLDLKMQQVGGRFDIPALL